MLFSQVVDEFTGGLVFSDQFNQEYAVVVIPVGLSGGQVLEADDVGERVDPLDLSELAVGVVIVMSVGRFHPDEEDGLVAGEVIGGGDGSDVLEAVFNESFLDGRTEVDVVFQ